MGNIADLLPKLPLTAQRIYEYYEEREKGRAGPHQGRLGASSLGDPCERRLWYKFRELARARFDGRMLRLFERGHREEDWLVEDLRSIGCTIHAIDDQTGKQFEYTAIGGHFVCHLDGKGLNLPEAPKAWHVLEFKTDGEDVTQTKNFSKVKANGIKKAMPKHYVQVQVGMGLSGIKRGMYIMVKKSTDDIWPERVHFDPEAFGFFMERAERIIRSVNVPSRITDRADDWRCGYCEARNLCWGLASVAVPIPELTCRSCCHATPEVDEGETEPRWSCRRFNENVSREVQTLACPYHLLLPGLVAFAEPVDGCMDWIDFQNHEDGGTWRHGLESEGACPTYWLMENSHTALLGSREKVPFDDGENLSLIDRYPPEDSYRIWEREGLHLDKAGEWESLGYPISILGVSSTHEDEECRAVEYGRDYLAVYHKKDNRTELWGGKR